MIRLSRVCKHYADGTAAVNGVDIEIPKGEFCVLLGSSGAGKSTLLKLINGMESPSLGSLAINGHLIGPRTRRLIQRKVSMIHQHFNLVNRLSVEINICSGAVAVLPLWRILFAAYPAELRRKAAILAGEVGLNELQFNRRCADLSGGQQQRVGISRAFLLDPEVVLADEPVASLDPATSASVLETLRSKAKEKGVTVVCSLHQVELAREFADRIIGLRGGKVLFDASPEDLDESLIGNLYRKTS